jgi:phospholipid/cholesterol/gamma-HCH transport system substrate-binding protein
VLHNLDGLIADVRARVGALDALRDGARDTGRAASAVERALVHDTLPRVDTLVRQLSRDADTLGEVLREIRDQPQSLILGSRPPPPGPGEPGFQARREARK